VKSFRWSPDKNERLKVERDISFEEIVLAIEESGLKARCRVVTLGAPRSFAYR